MKIIKSISDMKRYSFALHAAVETMGFAPTMGYLHDGHISLMRASKAANSKTVVSIFVNPAQFGPNEDLAAYPRDMDGDLQKCASAGVDAVFMPEAGEIYPAGFSTYIDVSGVTAVMEGIKRPGHFRGVATVVAKLFNIVMPARAYFGQKDYQQTVVIKKMVRDLSIPVEIVVTPTVREPDGLAMSSRNAYLAAEERVAAPVIYTALSAARNLWEAGEKNAEALIREVKELASTEPLMEVEYVEVSDALTLGPVREVNRSAVIAVAARIGRTRLIDNVLLESSVV